MWANKKQRCNISIKVSKAFLMNLSVFCMVNVLTLQQSMHITLPSPSTDIKDAAARLLLTSKERQDFWYRNPISALGFSAVAEYETELSAVLRYVYWDTDSISDPREKVIDGQFSAWCSKTERRGGLPIRRRRRHKNNLKAVITSSNEVVFSTVSVCWLVWLLDCSKTTEQIYMKLKQRMDHSQE